VPVGDAEARDPPRLALLLEPRQMLPPRDEVVHLLDLDTAEPTELRAELLPALVDRRRPDFRRYGDALASPVERDRERRLRAVHRRGVDDATACRERRADDLAPERRVAVERPPRPEADHGTEPALLHQPMNLRASRPAAKAAAKNAGSSRGPRPMCESGRPAQAPSQPVTSTSSRAAAIQPGASRPAGHPTATSPRQSSRTTRV